MAPRKLGFRQRARYWFDNTMSRGTAGLIGWLAVTSAALIVTITIGLSLVEGHAVRPDGSPPPTPLQLLWQTFVTTFSLAVPLDESAVPVLALWFVLALGGIFVVSALVGLLTSGLHRKLDQLRKGRSPVIEKDHTVILGWSDQVYTLVSELVEANRSRRRATIVILAEQDKITMEDRLQHRIPNTRNTRVVMRTGSPLDLTDLEMVNINTSRSIMVLAPEGLGAEDADAYVLKVLLAINRGPAFKGLPHHVVAAVRDGRNRAVARLAGGDAVVIDGDDISARLIVQTARQSRLSVIYHDLLDFGGDELYLISEPRLVGKSFGQTLLAYRKSCPIGLLHANGSTKLNPPMETVIGPNDKLVILAEDDSAIKLASRQFEVDTAAMVHSVRGPQAPERTLMLGWNGRAVRIIEQLDIYVTAGSAVDIVTDRADADMVVASLSQRLRRVTLRIKDGDTRDRNVLESLDVSGYGNVIVLSDDLLDPMTADSRVLVTLLHLRDMLAKRGRSVQIVSEMRDDRDRALAQLTRADDFVVSEQMVSLLMTQISENRHLESVFTDLFDPDGAEIYVRPANYYLREAPGHTFATVVESARRRGEVAIGYRIAEPGEGHGVVLNPAKDQPMPLIDRVIVLAHT
jgi:voltage-gated potassium channel Kch